ncbi:MAG: hypothetical protein WBB52_11515 [Acidimicrobiales bacterium]
MDAVKQRRTKLSTKVSAGRVPLKGKRSPYVARQVREDILARHRAGFASRRIAAELALPLKTVEAVLSAGKQSAGLPKKPRGERSANKETSKRRIAAALPPVGERSVKKETFEPDRLVKARVGKKIADLDYQRELLRAREGGASQRDMAKVLGMSQPSVKSALDTAAKVSMPLSGFAGASPGEICQRFAAGLIDRERLVDELTRFPYVQGDRTDGYDTLLVDPSGTWAEVSNAVRRGLIPDDVYEEVFIRRHAS